MRAIYLVRHGQPQLPEGERLCVGRMELPLSGEGRNQARCLGKYFAGLNLRVVSSPLERCRDTAKEISDEFGICGGLTELDMGDWTGLSFEDIRRRWPELYEKRGRDPENTAPSGGESLAQCAGRVTSAFWELLEECPREGLILSVHSGVIRALYASLTGRSASALEMPGCGSVTQLLIGGKKVYAGAYGVMPDGLPPAIPSTEECEALFCRFGTPEHVRAHCWAVAELAEGMCRRLNRRGEGLSEALTRAGALLHDLTRTQPRHDEYAARRLCELGYAAVGAVVGNHMSLGEEADGRWSESAVVFLADKLIQGTKRVSLDERFFAEPDPRKLPFIQERYELARVLLRRLREGETYGDDF